MSRFVCKCGYHISTTAEPNNTGGRFYGNQQLEEFFAFVAPNLSVADIEAWFIDNGKRGNYCPECHTIEIDYEKVDEKYIKL